MFNLLEKFGFNPAQSIPSSKPEVVLPVIRVPFAVTEEIAPPVEVEAKQSFSCLDDVFGELLEDQVSYALSKW